MPDTNTYTALSSTRKVVSKAELDAMDKTNIPVGTEYDIVAPIEQVDLSTELQTEIDGKIDKPATDGTSGQVLTMGTDGKTKWADNAIYRHNIYFHVGPTESYRITVYTSNATPYTPATFFANSDNITLSIPKQKPFVFCMIFNPFSCRSSIRSLSFIFISFCSCIFIPSIYIFI